MKNWLRSCSRTRTTELHSANCRRSSCCEGASSTARQAPRGVATDEEASSKRPGITSSQLGSQALRCKWKETRIILIIIHPKEFLRIDYTKISWKWKASFWGWWLIDEQNSGTHTLKKSLRWKFLFLTHWSKSLLEDSLFFATAFADIEKWFSFFLTITLEKGEINHQSVLSLVTPFLWQLAQNTTRSAHRVSQERK